MLHFLIRENLINENEKNKLLKKSESILIEQLKRLFEMSAWEWHPANFRNLNFLQENDINWENIFVSCQGSKAAIILL